MSWKYILKDDSKEEDGRNRRWEKRTSGGKKFSFIENFGFMNDAKISNWFKAIEKVFDQMLNDLGPKNVEAVDMFTGEKTDADLSDLTRGKSPPWTKKIKTSGTAIASEMLKGAVNAYLKSLEHKYMSGGYSVDGEFVTTSPPEIDPDSPDVVDDPGDIYNVDMIFASPEYTAIMKKTLDAVGSMLSVVLDTSYLNVRRSRDDPPPEQQNLQMDLNPLEELPDNVIQVIANQILGAKVDDKIDNVLSQLENQFEEGFGGEEASHYVAEEDDEKPKSGEHKVKLDPQTAKAVTDGMKQAFKSPEVKNHLDDFKAYIHASFMMKYPFTQRQQESHKVADQERKDGPPITQEGVQPAEGYTERRTRAESRKRAIDETEEEYQARLRQIEEDEEYEDVYDPPLTPAEEADERRRKFESKYASTNQSPKSWMDVLKNTGPTLTTSQGFAPTMHNLRYSCDCDDDCGCDN
tara:strand:- start:967 stop:2358 length:1392 start_codon:yes stop_codon:yes gene_type:complete